MKKKIHGNSKYHKILTEEFLIQEYFKKEKSRKQIAEELGCSKTVIKNKLEKFDIYIRTKKEANKLSSKLRMKNRRSYKHSNNPFFGKYHTEETRKKMRENQPNRFGNKNGMYGNPRIDLQIKFKGKGNPSFGKINHAKGSYYKNIYMRSSWEILFAQFLDLSNHKFLYEPKTFNLENMTYTPDFYLPEFDCYIEIKGYWYSKAKEKFKLFKKLYSQINLRILSENELKNMGILCK